ncbi:M10 family metallopeptidase C-terminal domain-containing protein [Epibacterium ulvae]|uniref:M10 family metallopeptidase C-terminal domain-containing protein n=1 Tax=Epibacterium ulvae TaxID=1156985 RepID=UPI002492B4E0|nr:M10 family metallopeptidase C-terminal domain-containing protein [Epibacterium ulvae]
MCELCILTQNFDPARHTHNLPWGTPTSDDTEVVVPPTGTLDELADYLTDGFWEDVGGTGRSFALSPGENTDYVVSVNLTELTNVGQRLARWALETWETVADIQFVEVQFGGDIQVDDEFDGAFAQTTTDRTGTEITEVFVNVDKTWISDFGSTLDSFTFSTYVHEFGHALGLGHLGNYNGSSGAVTFANDSYQQSVMSYIPQDQVDATNASFAEPTGPMMADILAIQSLYGASTITAGDTVWGQGGTYSRHFTTLFAGIDDEDDSTQEAGPIAFALFDDANDDGVDLIDLRPSTTDDVLNLRAETFSDVGGLTGNVAIARGSAFENARMGSGSDIVIGNTLDNMLWGHRGADDLYGARGNDTLFGGRGNDELFGGGGSDNLFGAQGRDELFGGGGSDNLFGARGNDDLFGGRGRDTLRGDKGDDYLDSGAGNDVMTGGEGLDQFFYGFGHDRDRITDFSLGEDELLFSAIDFENYNAERFVETYAVEQANGVAFEFGQSVSQGADYNDRLVLVGVFDLDALVDDIVFI